jgi:hypothetical protein
LIFDSDIILYGFKNNLFITDWEESIGNYWTKLKTHNFID